MSTVRSEQTRLREELAKQSYTIYEAVLIVWSCPPVRFDESSCHLIRWLVKNYVADFHPDGFADVDLQALEDRLANLDMAGLNALARAIERVNNPTTRDAKLPLRERVRQVGLVQD